MLWSVPFALLLLAVVLLKYLRRPAAVCPQCGTRREADEPLCQACGWIYEVPGEEDDDDEDVEEFGADDDDEAWRR